MSEAHPPGLVAAAWLIARKDLAIEYRTRTAFLSALVFSILALSTFYFAFDESVVPPHNSAPGVLWVVITFSAMLGLQRSFNVEENDRGIDALLVSPISRESIYLGKAIGNFVFLCGVQAVTIPALALFYNLPFGAPLLGLAGVVVLATIGIVAVGTLFSAMAVNTRLAELLLPMLSLPFFVPILMDAAQISVRVLAGRPLSESMSWLKILIAFDAVFLVACMLAFPFTLEE